MFQNALPQLLVLSQLWQHEIGFSQFAFPVIISCIDFYILSWPSCELLDHFLLNKDDL